MPIARVCQHCGASYTIHPSDLKRRARRYCSLPCYHQAMRRYAIQVCVVCRGPFDPRTAKRRWYCSWTCRQSSAAGVHRLRMLIAVCPHGDDCPYCCWEWQGARNPDGYGIVTKRRQGRRTTRQAHRLAWEAHHGRPIEAGLLCAHYCHNRRCCNPWHLHCGTSADNMADSVRDTRMARGEKIDTSRLCAEDIAAIFTRAAGGESATQIARTLGVEKITILRVLHRRTWKHIPLPAPLIASVKARFTRQRGPA
jgi:hypothetical protein